VLAAVTIGGGCFGIPGMLIGVPLTSAVYRIIREDLQKRNKIEAVVTEQKNDAAECCDEDVLDAEDSEKVEKN